MLPPRDDLEGILAAFGWVPFAFRNATQSGETISLFACPYAVAGFVQSERVEEAIERWPDAQSVMAALPEAGGVSRDRYLIFLLPTISEKAVPALQVIADDTYVCRKIILEKGDRPLAEVLGEIPLFSSPSLVGGSIHPPVSLTVDAVILEDLARRSAGVVVDKMLSGAYASPGESDAR